MNSKLLLTMLSALIITPLAVAESTDKNSARTHYKCHLMLLDKSEVVHGFVSTGKTQSEFEKALPGRMVYFADGVTGSKVEKIYQCVKAGQSFTGKQARELEAKKPF